MARFNTQSITTSVTGAGTVASPQAFTALNGTAPYTVALPSPVLFPGSSQTFYNATSGVVTISTPSGIFGGLGASGAGTLAIPTNTVVSITSDGVNYIVLSEDGSALVATTGSFSGNVTANGAAATVSLTPQTVTIAPTGASTIDNVNIGVSTRGSGAFTTLTANSAVTFTANTTSSSTGTGSLVVTGGVGVSGAVYASGLYGSLTGTVQTAAQPNITSLGTLTGLTVNASNIGTLNLGSTGASYVAASMIGTASTLYAPVGKLSFRLPTHGANTDYGLTEQMFIEGTGPDSRGAYKIVMLPYGGNVGIGTVSPSQKLEVYVSRTSSTNAIALLLNDNVTGGQTDGVYKAIRSASNTGASVSEIRFIETDGTNNNTAIAFATAPTAGGLTERMRVAPSGNVGIGTPSPSGKLHLYQTSGGANQLTLDTNFGSGNAYAINPFITGISNGGLSIRDVTNSVERLVIQYLTGNVGIGLTVPQARLELNDSASYNSSIYGQIKHLVLSRYENTRYNAYAGFGDQFGSNTFGWRFGTVNNSTDYPTLYMVNGNVGIGTSATPASPLTVSAVSGDGVPLLRLTSTSAPAAVNWISSSMNSSLTANASTLHLFGQAQSQYNSGYVGFRYAGASSSSNYLTLGLYASDYLLNILGNGNVGINITSPAAKLHIVNSSVGGIGSVPSGSGVIVDSSSNNYITLRNSADNATNAGIVFQDNNIGGYLIFRNYDAGGATSDRMFLAGYQGVNIQYGSADSTDVTARTTAATFDSTGIYWEKRKLVYSQDIPAPTGFVANTWYRLSGFHFNGVLDTGGTQPGWIIQIRFANLNPNYGYIHWVTAYIPPLSSNTHTGYQGGYTSSHYGNTSVNGSLVFNSAHHTSAGANHDIRLKLDSPSDYGVMNLYIWSNVGNNVSYDLLYRVWRV